MGSVWDISIGLTTNDGHWFGLRLRREARSSIADRNLEGVVMHQEMSGGPLSSEEKRSSEISGKPSIGVPHQNRLD